MAMLVYSGEIQIEMLHTSSHFFGFGKKISEVVTPL